MRSWHLPGTSIICDPSDSFEVIASVVHSAWAREAISHGETEHPHLKSYQALSEDQKEYVRVTVRAVLDELCLSRVMKPKEE